MEVLDFFKLPTKATVSQRIYTKDVVSALGVTGKDKTLIEKAVSTIHLVGIINEHTSDLWGYTDGNYIYEEVQLFSVVLKEPNHVKTLNEFIQKVFPNSIVVIYKYGSEFMLSTAMKRINKVDGTKTVIDSIQTTDWFTLDDMHQELLGKITYQKRDLKAFYEQIDYAIGAEYVAKVTGKVPEILDFTIKAKSLAIQQLLEEKRKLEQQEREESSMQGKMQCHMKIKEIEQKLEAMR